jgi:dUTP pyrophosphatase
MTIDHNTPRPAADGSGRAEERATEVRVGVVTLPHFEGLALPTAQTVHAAGIDVMAAVGADSPIDIAPGTLALVPTGLRMAIPPGWEIQVRPRSGLAARHEIGVLNSPGTIDADYRGEVKVILFNFGREPFRVERGTRIAQLVLARVGRIVWARAESLDETERGAGGFGSTGLS